MADNTAPLPTTIASSPVDPSASPGGIPAPMVGSGLTSLVTTALALAFVLALAWVLLRALKRLQQRGSLRGHARSGPEDVPQVMQTVGIGPRERLMTVHWRGRDYLLGVTAAGIALIDRADADDPVAAPDVPRPD